VYSLISTAACNEYSFNPVWGVPGRKTEDGCSGDRSINLSSPLRDCDCRHCDNRPVLVPSVSLAAFDRLHTDGVGWVCRLIASIGIGPVPRWCAQQRYAELHHFRLLSVHNSIHRSANESKYLPCVCTADTQYVTLTDIKLWSVFRGARYIHTAANLSVFCW